MKMETPLHQLDEEGASMDGWTGGRTDVRIVWIHSRGPPKEISRSRSRLAPDIYRYKCAAMKN